MKGIDISEHQKNVDYKKLKTDFVILRCSYGEIEDKLFLTHVKGLRDAGIPIVGVYVFDYSLDESGAKAEALKAVEICKKAGLSKDTIIFFDCEYDSVSYAEKQGVLYSRGHVQSHTRKFMNVVKSHGYRTGYYANLDWMKRYYNGFKKHDDEYFWFARYDHEPEYDYDFLQYTSSGRLDGYNGNLDMNEFKERKKMKKINPNEWINSHKGKIYDIDGVYGIQCVDLFKIFLKDIGYPNPSGPIGGDGYADQIWYLRDRYKDYFDFVTGELKPGDILLWPKGHPECPYSHVAMYVADSPKGNNRALFLGSNQGYEHSNGNIVDISCNGSLGALRYKGFTDKPTAPEEKKGVLVAESHTARVKKGHNINLRLGSPTGRIIGQIKAGESFKYDHKIVTNGHRYVVSGNLYLAITPTELKSDYWCDII